MVSYRLFHVPIPNYSWIVAHNFVKLPLKINDTKITFYFKILKQMSGALPKKTFSISDYSFHKQLSVDSLLLSESRFDRMYPLSPIEILSF